MKLFSNERLVLEIDINLSRINKNEIVDNGYSITIPYQDEDFLRAIKPLIDSVADSMELSWKTPNYSKCRAYFYIVGDSVHFSVEVFPKCYTAIEKQSMLDTVSKVETHYGWSDEIELMNMFDDIDEILNCSYPVGAIDICPLELTQYERTLLFSLIP